MAERWGVWIKGFHDWLCRATLEQRQTAGNGNYQVLCWRYHLATISCKIFDALWSKTHFCLINIACTHRTAANSPKFPPASPSPPFIVDAQYFGHGPGSKTALQAGKGLGRGRGRGKLLGAQSPILRHLRETMSQVVLLGLLTYAIIEKERKADEMSSSITPFSNKTPFFRSENN